MQEKWDADQSKKEKQEMNGSGKPVISFPPKYPPVLQEQSFHILYVISL